MVRLCWLWAQLFYTTCPSMYPAPVVLTRPSLPQHTDLLPLVELAAMCSPGLEFHFTALGILGEIEITSMLCSLQHPCPSGTQFEARLVSRVHAMFPGELAHPLPMLGTCVKLGAVGESVQSLKEGCTRGRGKKGLCSWWERASRKGRREVELAAAGGQGLRMGWCRLADSDLLCVSS